MFTITPHSHPVRPSIKGMVILVIPPSKLIAASIVLSELANYCDSCTCSQSVLKEQWGSKLEFLITLSPPKFAYLGQIIRGFLVSSVVEVIAWSLFLLHSL